MAQSERERDISAGLIQLQTAIAYLKEVETSNWDGVDKALIKRSIEKATHSQGDIIKKLSTAGMQVVAVQNGIALTKRAKEQLEMVMNAIQAYAVLINETKLVVNGGEGSIHGRTMRLQGQRNIYNMFIQPLPKIKQAITALKEVLNSPDLLNNTEPQNTRTDMTVYDPHAARDATSNHPLRQRTIQLVGIINEEFSSIEEFLLTEKDLYNGIKQHNGQIVEINQYKSSLIERMKKILLDIVEELERIKKIFAQVDFHDADQAILVLEEQVKKIKQSIDGLGVYEMRETREGYLRLIKVEEGIEGEFKDIASVWSSINLSKIDKILEYGNLEERKHIVAELKAAVALLEKYLDHLVTKYTAIRDELGKLVDNFLPPEAEYAMQLHASVGELVNRVNGFGTALMNINPN